MGFHFPSEADSSPRCFQDPSLGDLKNWMVNSNFGTWSCFFANIFQVRHGVLDILSCWFHPHGNDQYEQELNLVLLEDFFDPHLSSLDATLYLSYRKSSKRARKGSHLPEILRLASQVKK